MSEALEFNPELHRMQRARLEELVAERDRLTQENVMLRSLVSTGLVEETQPTEATEKKSAARRK
jgi:regulator of replication initiation timing